VQDTQIRFWNQKALTLIHLTNRTMKFDQKKEITLPPCPICGRSWDEYEAQQEADEASFHNSQCGPEY